MLSMALDVNPYVVCTCVCLCAIMIYRYMRDTFSVIQNLGIPCPKPVWVFGNVLAMKNKFPLTVFDEWRKQYGDVYGFYEGFRAGIVVHGHEMAQEILSKNFDSFYIRPGYRPFQYYPDDKMIININGEEWKNQRAVLNKTLNTSGIMKELFHKAQHSSVDMIKKIEKERQHSPEGFHIDPLVQKFTSDSMISILLDMSDEDLRCYGDTLYEYALESIKSASADNEVAGLASLFPLLTPLLKLSDKKHKECHGKVVEILQKHIASVAERQNNNDTPSILSHLISSTVQTRDIDGSLTRRKLADDELLAHVLGLLSETYATTASISLFILYELARNPKVQEKLYDEVCQACGKDGNIQGTALQSMDYFDMVFYETYRLHPIAPGIGRKCNADCTVRGVRFKKGMVVRVMSCTMYNDPELFSNPEQFNPDRFSRENERPQFSFIPYGLGPRMCPGQKIAGCVVKLAVANILTRFRLEITDTTEIPIKHALRPVVVPANGVHLKLVPRS